MEYALNTAHIHTILEDVDDNACIRNMESI